MMVNRSIGRLTNVFLALFLLLSGGIVYWQVFDAQTLTTSTYNPRRCDPGNQPMRGSIYDRNGVLLAYTEYDPNATGCARFRRYYCFPSLSPIIGYFSYIYGETGLEETYDEYLTGQAGAGTSAINNFWDQTLHRPVYGSDIYLTIDWRVQNLIDKEYDISYDEPGGTFPSDPIHHVATGTIGPDNRSIPAKCDQNLASQAYNQPAEGTPDTHAGAIIVEDPHTGEILGMLSRPYYDANVIGDYRTCRLYTDTAIYDAEDVNDPLCPGAQAEPPSGSQDNNTLSTIGNAYFQILSLDEQYAPLLPRPTQGSYVPGSTFKTVTLTAGLDTGKYHLTDKFGGNNCLADSSEARRYTVNGRVFQDRDLLGYNPLPKCPIDLEHGYIYSDNIIYARVGVGVGADTWVNYIQRFGLVDQGDKQSIPFDLPVRPSTVQFHGDDGVLDDNVNLADSAFGQGTLQVTPLTMALVTSTVANNGVAMQPSLLYKVVPHGVNPNDTNNIVTYSPKQYGNGPIMSQSTAQDILKSMRGVVTQGSAGLIFGNQDNVGGKTGTGQTDNDDPQSWFISLAPDNPGQTPKLVVIVTKEKGDEGLFQAPIADCIYLNLPDYLGLSNNQTPLPNVRDGTSYPRYRCA